jgi:hypothetical protein
MKFEEARKLALSLPEAVEAPHFEMLSFRIGKKIFATVPPESDFVHVFVDEEEIRAAILEHPKVCDALMWGQKLAGVRVRLAALRKPAILEALLRSAWKRKAPKRLLKD